MNRRTAGYLFLLLLALAAPRVIYPVFLMKALCFALFACAFNLLLGFTGLLSFGHAAFLGTAGYATGQALTALHESGVVPISHPAYQRGIRFLLDTQLADGSWYVRTRTLPAQRYFDGDFPHGVDQFISIAATNWAVMALAPAAR